MIDASSQTLKTPALERVKPSQVQSTPYKGIWAKAVTPSKKGLEYTFFTDAEYVASINQNRMELVTTNMPLDLEGIYAATKSGIDYVQPYKAIVQEHPRLGLGYEPSWSTEWSHTELIGFDYDIWDTSEKGMAAKLPFLDAEAWFYYADADVPMTFASFEAQDWLARHQGRPFGKLDVVDDDGKPTHKLKTPLRLSKNGIWYRLRLHYVDLVKIGLAGKGYAGLLELSGISTDDKKLMDDYKSNMIYPYKDPALHDDFMQYSVYDVQPGGNIIQERLRLQGRVGLQVAGVDMSNRFIAGNGSYNMALLEAGIKKKAGEHEPWKVDNLDAKPSDIMIKTGFKYHSKYAESQRAKLGLSAGGMARNMNPTKYRYDLVVDNDGKGMYVGIMNQTDYCFGVPTYWGASTSKKREKLSLAKFLKKFKGQLEARCWVAMASNESLSFAQSLILSKVVGGKMDVEAEQEFINAKMDDKDELDDSVMLLTQHIVNGVLTSDILEVAKAAMNGKEWKEFTENTEVQTYAVFEAKNEVEDFEAMAKAYEGKTGTIVESVNRKGQNIQREDRSKAWVRVPLSEYAGKMGDLRDEVKTKRAAVKNAIKTCGEDILAKLQAESESLNIHQQGYKLMGNSVFGSLASSVLKMANLVAAHNITGAGRAWVWAHSIAMNAAVAVTDGGFFEINNVSKLSRQADGSKRYDSMNMRTLKNRPERLSRSERNNISGLGPLTSDEGSWKCEVIGETKDGECIKRLSNSATGKTFEGYEENWQELSDVCYDHMVDYWTDNKGYCPQVILDTRHAIKDVHLTAIAHGQTNYGFFKADGTCYGKARGHKMHSNNHSRVEGVEGSERSDMYVLLEALRSGSKVPAFKPAYRPEMLKSDVYRARVTSSNDNLIKERGILPGSTIHKRTWLRPLTLSMFQFQTYDQRLCFFNAHDRMKAKDGYGLEKFYMDSEGAIDYGEMIADIQARIDEGHMGYLDEGKTKVYLTDEKLSELPTHPYNPID